MSNLCTIFTSSTDLRPRPCRSTRLSERLIVFTRYPRPGNTKTRLIPALGRKGAADLQRRMTEHVVASVRELALARPVQMEVRYDSGSKRAVSRWLGPGVKYASQGAGNLGERMERALRQENRRGRGRSVLIGSDCPGITAAIMGNAFDALLENDLVLGPSHDGGYYLIGVSSEVPPDSMAALFKNMPWGTEEVFQRTVHAAKEQRLSLFMLQPLDDVDRPEDLSAWERVYERAQEARTSAPISIIIPTLNEAGNIETAIQHAATGWNVEIIVVDGGSHDKTVQIASSLGVRVIPFEPRRAKQLNAGAAAASGELLLFLHADTRLPQGFDVYVRRTLAEPGVIAGAFELSYDVPLGRLRVIEQTANWRARRRQMPYGDQGLFIRKKVFHQLGGFPDMPIMEDVAFVRNLRRRGRVAIAPAAVVTSARRYLTLGPLTTAFLNKWINVAYAFHVSPARIARWYRGWRPGPEAHR